MEQRTIQLQETLNLNRLYDYLLVMPLDPCRTKPNEAGLKSETLLAPGLANNKLRLITSCFNLCLSVTHKFQPFC